MSPPSIHYIPDADNDPYAREIEKFLGMEFPQLGTKDTEDIMEAVMFEFMGSKQYRVGPRPNPESEVKMRDVVRRAIQAERAIPLYIPSASVKVPVAKSFIDVAELSALRTLQSLQHRVQRHYPAGFSMRMRMEDLTEYVLSGPSPEVRGAVTDYISKFKLLVKVLQFDNWLTLLPESDIVDEKLFLKTAGGIQVVMDGYLRGKVTFEETKRYGLAWPITQEMRQYFIDRYKKLYPHYGEDDYITAMAAYFSSTLARKILKASGYDTSFDGRLELYFGIKLPDAPVVSTRIYYRTVPRSQSSFHAPYWNAKGYLKINGDGVPRITLGPWEGEYHTGRLELSNEDTSVSIQADYVLE